MTAEASSIQAITEMEAKATHTRSGPPAEHGGVVSKHPTGDAYESLRARRDPSATKSRPVTLQVLVRTQPSETRRLAIAAGRALDATFMRPLARDREEQAMPPRLHELAERFAKRTL